jgi:hypothetical protein
MLEVKACPKVLRSSRQLLGDCTSSKRLTGGNGWLLWID